MRGGGNAKLGSGNGFHRHRHFSCAHRISTLSRFATARHRTRCGAAHCAKHSRSRSGRLQRFAMLPAIFSAVIPMRLLALGAIVASTAALLRLAGPARTVAFAFSPLIFLESIVNGHNDALMLAPALWALASLDDAPLLSVLLLGLSIAMKYVTVLLLPFVVARIWHRYGGKSGVLACIGSLVAFGIWFAPFWSGPRVLASIYAKSGEIEFSLSSLIGSALSTIARAPGVGTHHPSWTWLINHLLTLALVVVLAAQVPKFAKSGMADPRPLWRTMIALLIALPALGPYILVWFAPMLVERGRVGFFARVLIACGIGSYFVMLPLQTNAKQSLAFAVAVVVVPISAALLFRPKRTSSVSEAGALASA